VSSAFDAELSFKAYVLANAAPPSPPTAAAALARAPSPVAEAAAAVDVPAVVPGVRKPKRFSYRFEQQISERMSSLGIEPVAVTASMAAIQETTPPSSPAALAPRSMHESPSQMLVAPVPPAVAVAMPTTPVRATARMVVAAAAPVSPRPPAASADADLKTKVLAMLADPAQRTLFERYCKRVHAVENYYAMRALDLVQAHDFINLEGFLKKLGCDSVANSLFDYLTPEQARANKMNEMQRVELCLGRKVFEAFFRQDTSEYWTCLSEPTLNALFVKLDRQRALPSAAFDNARKEVFISIMHMYVGYEQYDMPAISPTTSASSMASSSATSTVRALAASGPGPLEVAKPRAGKARARSSLTSLDSVQSVAAATSPPGSALLGGGKLTLGASPATLPKPKGKPQASAAQSAMPPPPPPPSQQQQQQQRRSSLLQMLGLFKSTDGATAAPRRRSSLFPRLSLLGASPKPQRADEQPQASFATFDAERTAVDHGTFSYSLPQPKARMRPRISDLETASS